MTQAEAQLRIQQLIELAWRSPPDSNEARNAALKAVRLIREQGLFICRLDELATFAPAPPPAVVVTAPPAPPAKKRARPKRKTTEVVVETADTITTALDAGARIADSMQGFMRSFGRR